MTRTRLHAALAAAALLAGVAVAPAFAHGQKPGAGQGRVVPVLDPLPEALASLRVQIHDSLAPQLVLENTGWAPIELIDTDGAPFARIGPDGVDGNLASATFYRSASPSDAVPVSQDAIDAAVEGRVLEPRWRRVGAQPSWGWFDRRIEVDQIEVPHEVALAGRRAEFGRWSIPVRVAGASHALAGRFVYEPAARGMLQLRMTGPRQLAPGVSVALLPGRGGSFFLANESQSVVSLLDGRGEPFLRLSPAGVEGNRASATYLEVARLRGSSALQPAPRDGTPHWEKLSSVPRFGWTDPRTLVEVSEAVQASGKKSEVARWSLPVRVGEGKNARRISIDGATWWQPVSRKPRKE